MSGDTIDIVVARRFDAPPEAVFDAWFDAETVAHFLFRTPDGVVERVIVEPRVGGRLEVAEKRGDILAEHFCTFVEIERPRRIVFDFKAAHDEPPSRVEIDIAPDGDGAMLTLTHTMDARWAEFTDRVRDGWTNMLARAAPA